MNVTEKYYEEYIPECCGLQTVKEHKERLMLCWGLLHDMEAGIDTRKKQCGRECDLHVNHDHELLAKILKEHEGEWRKT